MLAPKPHVFAAAVLILQFFTFGGSAQDLEIGIKINSNVAEVRSKFIAQPPPSIWFLENYGPISLHERLSAVYFYDKAGFLIARRHLLPSDTLKTANFNSFAFSVDLKPQYSPFAAAHVSWLNDSVGLLMLDDLLPQMPGKSAKVSFEIPAGWTIVSAENELSPGVFNVGNLEKAVFYLGKDLRIIKTPAATLAISGGNWLFQDSDAVAMTNSIMGDYAKVFGPLKSGNAIVRISEFPLRQMIGAWEAGTRGRSVTIVSADMPFRNQSLQRLHEQLRHELFHLWMPNGVNLTGNYDWFYEGFALYQSLKTGVAANQIRFEDYLNTLSQAHANHLASTPVSLIDASQNRWNGNNSNVYARGMLVAFLFDLAMLDASNGKRSVTNLIAEIVKRHSGETASVSGNEAIVSAMRSRRELVGILDSYVTASRSFDVRPLLEKAGLELDGVRIIKKPSPNSGQKKMLERLGYENWRRVRE